MSAQIRPASAADAPAIADLYLASRKTFLPFAPLAHSDEQVRAWIAQLLLPAGQVRVCELHAQLTGMLATSHDGEFAWIDQLYLRPGWQGQGLGALLLNHAHQVLAPPIRLYVFQANHGARRFYERHGYRVIASSDGRDNEERCPDHLMQRDLPPG